MTDILLALCVGLALALGYLPMKRLDRFLERNREAVEGRGAFEAPREERTRGDSKLRARPSLPGGWRVGKLFPLRHRG